MSTDQNKDFNFNTKAAMAKVAAIIGACGGVALSRITGYSDPVSAFFVCGVISWAAAYVNMQAGFAAIGLSGLLLLKSCGSVPDDGGKKPFEQIIPSGARDSSPAPGAPNDQSGFRVPDLDPPKSAPATSTTPLLPSGGSSNFTVPDLDPPRTPTPDIIIPSGGSKK